MSTLTSEERVNRLYSKLIYIINIEMQLSTDEELTTQSISMFNRIYDSVINDIIHLLPEEKLTIYLRKDQYHAKFFFDTITFGTVTLAGVEVDLVKAFRSLLPNVLAKRQELGKTILIDSV